MEKYSPRPDVFKTNDLPDSNVNQTFEFYEQKIKSCKVGTRLGALKFESRPVRDIHLAEKFKSPDFYDNDKLSKGRELLSSNKNIKGQVSIKN